MVIQWLLNGHIGLVANDYVKVVVFAAIGSAVSMIVRNPGMKLPKIIDGELHLGALGHLIVGLATAVGIGYHPPIPFLVGLFAPVFVPFVVKSSLPVMTKALTPMIISIMETLTTPKKETQNGK